MSSKGPDKSTAAFMVFVEEEKDRRLAEGSLSKKD